MIGGFVPLKEIYKRMIELGVMTREEAIRDLRRRLETISVYDRKEIEETIAWLEKPRETSLDDMKRELRGKFERLKSEVTPCDVCGNVELNWDRGWFVSDEEWQQVVPEKWQDKTLCPWCFVKFAAERGKEYQVTFYPWDPSIASGVKRVEGEGK